MLRITRVAANGEVVFKLSGEMSAENIGELETLLSAEASGLRIRLGLERPDAGGSGHRQFS